MRNWIIGAGLLLATLAASAQTVTSIEVLEYGTYRSEKGKCEIDAQGVQRCQRINSRHVATTDQVPAEIGVQFGMIYRVKGTPGGVHVPITRIWVLPEPGMQAPGAAEPRNRIERTEDVLIGDTNFASYGFDEPWELIPGTWLLEFWIGQQKLGQMEFNVVKK